MSGRVERLSVVRQWNRVELAIKVKRQLFLLASEFRSRYQLVAEILTEDIDHEGRASSDGSVAGIERSSLG